MDKKQEQATQPYEIVARQMYDATYNPQTNAVVIDHKHIYEHSGFDMNENIISLMNSIVHVRHAQKTLDEKIATYYNNCEEINHEIMCTILDHLTEEELIDDALAGYVLSELKLNTDYAQYLVGKKLYSFYPAVLKSYRDMITRNEITVTIDYKQQVNILEEDIATFGHNTRMHYWIAPMQEDNHNREGESVGASINDIRNALENYDELSIDELVDSTHLEPVLESLFFSQGYTLYDLLDLNTRRNSAFLRSFADEALNLTGNPPLLGFLVAYISLSASDIHDMMLGTTNAIIIPANSEQKPYPHVGLFDPTLGSGSVCEIHLERDWIIPWTAEDAVISFSGLHPLDDNENDYGYSPYQVYGDVTVTEAPTAQLP